jgi:hypothetical protein
MRILLTLLLTMMFFTSILNIVTAADDDGGGGDEHSVTLIRPAGGEIYTAGYELDILFSNTGLTEILVELKLDSDSEWITLGTKSTEPDTSSWWTWGVSNHSSTTAQVRVSSTSNPEIYDTGDYFTILEHTDNVTQLEPIPFESKSSGCNGGQSANAEYRSSGSTLWANLGMPPYMGTGEPDWSSATMPLSQTSVPPSTSSDWNLSRVQHNTPYFINSATVYTYPGNSLYYTTSPGGSEYVWVDNTQNTQWSTGHGTIAGHDFNGMVGTFVFRHDFQVPADAYDFEFAVLGNADDYFIKDPYTGTSDFSIRLTSQLSVPITNLGPNPSDTHPPHLQHIGASVANNPIQYSYGTETTFNQATDLSFVLFVDNIRLMGALGFHLTVKYCVPLPVVTPVNPMELPETGNVSSACGSTYDGGILSVSNDADTGYRMHTGSTQTAWYPTESVSGTYNSLGGNTWHPTDTMWNAGSPMLAHAPTQSVAGYLTSPHTLPANADDSEWVWNGNYVKEYGLHEFGQLVSLNNLNIPQSSVLTDLDAVVYFSADDQLLSVATSNAAQTQHFGTMHIDMNTLFSNPTPYHMWVQRTGVVGNGYTIHDIFRPIIDPSTNQPPTDSILFRINAIDHTNPQFAGTGQIENVDPAGIRFAILLCAKWEFPSVPVTEVKCLPEEIELYSGENQTEIRALQRNIAGLTTWELGQTVPGVGSVPAHFEPEPWQDMIPLEYKLSNAVPPSWLNPNHPNPLPASLGGASGPTYTLMNQNQFPGGGGGYSHITGNPLISVGGGAQHYQNACDMWPGNYAMDWFPIPYTGQNANMFGDCLGPAVVQNNGNMYQAHNTNAEWMMYGNPVVDGTVRATGEDQAHKAPMGLKEVRIPFTIPTDADPGSVEIVGNIGLAADAYDYPPFAYVYPACIGPGGTGSVASIPCVEDTMFPDFTHGVSIVAQGSNPSVALQSITADPNTNHRQVDSRTNGLPISFTAVQAPGDYYLKFYIAVDRVNITHPSGQQNEVVQHLAGAPGNYYWEDVIVIEQQAFAMKWAFDVEYEVCILIQPPPGGGSSSGSGIPFISPTTVMLVMAVAAFTVSRKNGNEKKE